VDQRGRSHRRRLSGLRRPQTPPLGVLVQSARSVREAPQGLEDPDEHRRHRNQRDRQLIRRIDLCVVANLNKIYRSKSGLNRGFYCVLERLVLCIVLLTAGCAGHKHQVVAPTTVPPVTSWRSVELPSHPTSVISSAKLLWVCGADELIADSNDNGRTWQVKHRNSDGSVLLSIGFANDQIGFAAGTDGTLLLTRNGGAMWTSVHTDDDAIYNVSFADEHNGMIQTRWVVKLTHDGGATWSEVSFLRTEPQLKDFQFVLALAVLDTNHMAVLLKQGPATYYDQRIALTQDGGKNWKVENIEHVGIGALFARNGEYWALGGEVIDRSNHGGHSVSLVMHSSDGENWMKQPRPAREIENCSSSGCLLWNGAGVDPFGAESSYWTFPPEKPTSAKWAATNSAICTIIADLQCADVSPSPQVPAYSDDTPMPAVATPPALGAPRQSGLVCISCPFEQFIVDQEFSGRAEIGLDLVIAANGTVSQAKILYAPNPSIGERYVNAARSWVFEPTRRDGVAVQAHTTVKLNVQVIKSE
jgi:photosystem II stability/assembly factor-like uncharacterized protein